VPAVVVLPLVAVVPVLAPVPLVPVPPVVPVVPVLAWVPVVAVLPVPVPPLVPLVPVPLDPATLVLLLPAGRDELVLPEGLPPPLPWLHAESITAAEGIAKRRRYERMADCAKVYARAGTGATVFAPCRVRPVRQRTRLPPTR
jgi:hypothetical protein